MPVVLSRLLVYWAAFCLLALAVWIGRTFGEPSIDQVLYHLRYSESSAVHMGRMFLFTLVMEVPVFALAVALPCTYVHTRLLADARQHARLRRLLRAAPRLATVAGVFALLLQLSVFSYAAAYLEPDRFGAEYVNPSRVSLHPGRTRNLVLIYAESLEEAYGDRAAFGRDLLAPLRQLRGASFAWYRPAPGATWTIAGIVATQCGLPLTVYSEHDTTREPGERAFLPGAVCLGDLLAARGFRNVFLGGAPLSFAGKGAFLRDHGYEEVYGLDEWQARGLAPQERNEWGLYDSALLQRARATLDRLHASGQPFNLTLLTLDTHNPHGFLSPACRARGARDFEGIVACGSAQLAEFVQYARQRGYLRDTTIVILGDHLAAPNPAQRKLQQAQRRGIFNLVVPATELRANTEVVGPFDFFPTLVELAGFDVEGDRLGLGHAAVGPADGDRPPEPAPITLATLHGSAAYRALWERSGED